MSIDETIKTIETARVEVEVGRGDRRMKNGEKLQEVFPDIKKWGESKDTLDYSLGGTVHRAMKSWWNAEYKEPSVSEKQNRWIPASEKLPENANHLGALCPRYMISSAKYGVTEGWYNPDRRTWYGLIWQLTPGNIDMRMGDIPAVIRMIDVTAWMELPKAYKTKEESEEA